MTDINLFKKTLDQAYPVKTPAQEKMFSELETKQKMMEYRNMLAPKVQSSNEQMLASEGLQLEQANYNIDELFNQTSSGEYIAKFPTYTPGRDNYDYFARNQSKWDKWMSGATQFTQTVVSSIAGLGNLVYGTGAMIAEGEFSAFYDNDYMNWLDDVSEQRRLNNPIYKTYEEQQMGFGESLGTASFWADDFLQGTAFTAGMIASEAVLRVATGGVLGGSMITRAGLGGTKYLGQSAKNLFGTMSKARTATTSPIVQGMTNTLKGIRGAEFGNKLAQASNIARTMVTSAAYEAGFEARHFMREMRQNFDQEFFNANGYEPTEQDRAEFEDALKSQANELFTFNLAVVGASNIAQFGSALGVKLPKISNDNWFNSKLFGAGIKDGVAITATKAQIGARIGYTFGRNAVMEGVVEEGLQAVGSNTSETLLKATYDKSNTEKTIGYVEAFKKGLHETYGTEEGRKEVYLGMLIGALTGSAMNMYQSKSFNPSDTNFAWLDKRAKGLEEELMKGTYSAKVLAENLFASNRTMAFKLKEEEASKKGDFLGGQEARAGQIYSQALRGVNLEYADEIKKQTILQLQTAEDSEIAKMAGVDESQAKELRDQMIAEYSEQFDKAMKYQETANALIGNALSKGEMQEFEKVVDEYVAKGYKEENAKAEAVSVLRSALGFELFMGDVAYNHSEEMKNAFLNELGNTFVTENVRKALDIHDALKRAGKSKQLEFGRVRKEIVKTKDEISKIEKEYKTVENLIAQATAETSNRQELIGRLNNLTNKKNELTERQTELEAQANTLLKASVIQNRFGKTVSAPTISAQEIEELEKTISDTMETLDALPNEKGMRAKKFLQEYEKSVEAFKRYDQRVNQLLDPKVGLRGKKGILPSFFSAKTPAEQTADMIRGLLNTHFTQQVERARLADDRINAIEDQVQVNKEDIKNYLEDQPYLFEQYNGSLDDVLPTKEEVEEFYRLVEKDKAVPEDLQRKIDNLKAELASTPETITTTTSTQSNTEVEQERVDIERREGFNGVEEIIFSNPNFRLEGFEIDGNYWNVVTSTDRAKVLVNINGVIVPFYLTTGQAGKGLVPGWYPFFGIGKDGWLNKTDKSDMETYYERYWGKDTADIVKSISEELNSFYGTEPSTFKNDGDPNATSRPLSTLADKVEDYINSKLNYTPAINNADARKTLRVNVEQLGKEINAKYDAELAKLEETTPETKTEVKPNPRYEELKKEIEQLEAQQKSGDNLTPKERERLEELTNKLANWSLTEVTSLRDIVLQEALRKTEVVEKPIEDLTEEDVNTMVDEEKEKRPFNFLQTVSHVYVKHFPKSATYVFSHITPRGFLEMLGQTTGLTAYDKETEQTSDITIDDVNDLKQGTIVSFGNNFSFKIGDGRNVVLYASQENFSSLGINFRATPSNYSVVLGTDGKPMPTDYEDAITYSFDEAMNLESGSTLIAKVDMDDPYNKSLSDEEFENSVRITFYDENGNKVSMLKGTREGETEIAPENYLKLRASAVKNAKGKEGLIELGEANIETIFIGAPIVEGEFAIDENLIETTGNWDGNKLTLDKELKGVRVDLLKGLDKSLPVVVVKKGSTLIAYPVKGGRVDSNQADSFTETGAELAIKINQTLIDNNLSPEPIYFNSAEDNNMYNTDGSKTEALLSAIEKVNKIPAKEFDLTSATINIDLEGQRFLPPKISIDLDSVILYDEPAPQRLLLGQGAVEEIVSEEVVTEPEEGDLFTLNYSEGDLRDIQFKNGKFGSEISGKFVAEYDKNQPYYRWLFNLASKNGGVIEEYDHKEFKGIFETATENFRDKESKEELNKKC
jgi:hypothetical protein